MLTEINIDGMIGPTHHYGGLGVGNIASHSHRNEVSNPRQAALEGLAKAKLVSDLGIPQFLWLPPRRPKLELLKALGFNGSPQEQILSAYELAPRVLSAAFSSAFMWAANSATVTPAVDASDGCYHFTPANLISSLHRASEANERRLDFANTFSVVNWHRVHDPLPGIMALRDEGAANHMRLSNPTGEIGFNIFVYGEDDSLGSNGLVGSKFMARQTRLASESIARQHRLNPATTFFLRQHPEAIAAGVFHNDVIATSHEGVLVHHELAFVDAEEELERLERAFFDRVGKALVRIVVSSDSLNLTDAVQSYLFNSQLLTPSRSSRSDSQPRMVFVCPKQCETIESANRVLRSIVADPKNPIDDVQFVSVGQSMSGGGGPACLRLRVPADQRTLEQLPYSGRMTESFYEALRQVVETYYPESVSLASFCDERFVEHLDVIDDALYNRRIKSVPTNPLQS